MNIMGFLSEQPPEYRELFLDAVEHHRNEDDVALCGSIDRLMPYHTAEPEDQSEMRRLLLYLITTSAVMGEISELTALSYANHGPRPL